MFCSSVALELLKNAIAKAGYTDKIVIGMDVAASEFFKGGKYDLDFKSPDDPSRYITPDKLADLYKSFVKDYPGEFLTPAPFFLLGNKNGSSSNFTSKYQTSTVLSQSFPSRTPLTRTTGRHGPNSQPAPASRWWETTSPSPTPNVSPRASPTKPATACCSRSTRSALSQSPCRRECPQHGGPVDEIQSSKCTLSRLKHSPFVLAASWPRATAGG